MWSELQYTKYVCGTFNADDTQTYFGGTMYEFEILNQNIRIEAASLEEGLCSARLMGVDHPVLRLAHKIAPTAYRATLDVREMMLGVTLPTSAEQALSFLRSELGFRQRTAAEFFGGIGLTAVWSPEREDAIGIVMGLFIERVDGLDEDAPLRGTPEYFQAMAKVWLADPANQIPPRALWRKLEALATREEAWRNDTSDPLAPRWAARLAEQLAFLRAVAHQANADLVHMLEQVETGDEVLVDDVWHRVLRINEKSLRLESLDDGRVRNVKRDQVTDWRDGEPLVKPATLEVSPGDYVFHRTGWYEVVDVRGEKVTARNKRRTCHLLRNAIGGVRSAGEHVAAIERNRANARRLASV